MYIYWLGESSFKIKTDRATIIIDPSDKKTGLSQSALAGDIIVISHTLETDAARVSPLEEKQFIVSSPGEYETREVFIYGHTGKNNTVLYLIKADQISFALLAGVYEALEDKALELFEGADIAATPVGGNGVLSGKLADTVISQIEPRIVIPMNFAIPKLILKRDPVDVFLKEMGIPAQQSETSLYITKDKLPGDETRVVLLSP